MGSTLDYHSYQRTQISGTMEISPGHACGCLRECGLVDTVMHKMWVGLQFSVSVLLVYYQYTRQCLPQGSLYIIVDILFNVCLKVLCILLIYSSMSASEFSVFVSVLSHIGTRRSLWRAA